MNYKDKKLVRKSLGNINIIEEYQHEYYTDEYDISSIIDTYFFYKNRKSDELKKAVLRSEGNVELINCDTCRYHIENEVECEKNNRFIISKRCTNFNKWDKC